jgi:hypothetical protein
MNTKQWNTRKSTPMMTGTTGTIMKLPRMNRTFTNTGTNKCGTLIRTILTNTSATPID